MLAWLLPVALATTNALTVAATLMAELRRRKDELQFSIFAVLVDVGSSDLSTLAQMSDRVTSVKKLSAEGTREIFLKI